MRRFASGAVANGFDVERHGQTGAFEAGAKARNALRLHGMAQELLLLAPDDLHRAPGGPGEKGRLKKRVVTVGEEVTAKEAPEQWGMYPDLLRSTLSAFAATLRNKSGA